MQSMMHIIYNWITTLVSFYLAGKNTCAQVHKYKNAFAVKIWNAVSEDKLSAGSPNTPTSLISSIKSYDYYENNRTIVYNSTIGYVEDGIYYSENPYELETDMVDFAVNNNIPLFG